MKNTLIAIAATALFGLSTFASAQSPAAPAATAAPATASTDLAGTKDDAKAMKKTADATYKDAKKACKPMKGAEEKACMKDAKIAHERAEVKAKGIHEMAEAKSDKEKAKVVAKYNHEVAEVDKKAAKK